MTFLVSVLREKSTDPDFVLSVSIFDGPVSVTNAMVEVKRVPPKVNISYPPEVEEILPQIDQKKLELEILNTIVAYIMQISGKNEIRTNSKFGRKL